MDRTIGGGGSVITLAASAARVASANGTAVDTIGCKRAVILCDITVSATAAGDTLDVYIDVLGPDGATWLNAVHFTQQAGNGAAKKMFAILESASAGATVTDVTSDAASGAVRPSLFGTQMRARWALVDGGGGDTSHTFSVTAYVQ